MSNVDSKDVLPTWMHTNFPQWTTHIEAYLSLDITNQLMDIILKIVVNTILPWMRKKKTCFINDQLSVKALVRSSMLKMTSLNVL
jgi:hypothetical protein